MLVKNNKNKAKGVMNLFYSPLSFLNMARAPLYLLSVSIAKLTIYIYNRLIYTILKVYLSSHIHVFIKPGSFKI
jgi:hypothetical protein